MLTGVHDQIRPRAAETSPCPFIPYMVKKTGPQVGESIQCQMGVNGFVVQYILHSFHTMQYSLHK